jgi:hypothetical protein
MTDYDVRSIFEQMELELIASMKRNLSRHQKWEKDEKINWTMWQAEQLRTFENFKKENEKIFGTRFTSINNAIADFLKENASTAGFEQERLILEQLAKGNKVNYKIEESLSGAFFSLNKDKMNALINATVNDMKKAEHAMLRMVNDQYRKTIFRAQVMANSGAFTLKQSIDAATKDFLKAGINCIEYKDGRRVNIATYAEMAVRTANKRAVLQSEGEARDAYGVHTVRISKYGGCSETCLPWQGRIYVDDIWSGGTKEEANEKKLPLLSEAVEGGLFHPNCKHRATTYFYDLEKALEDQDEEGLENPLEEQEHRKNQLHIQQQKRLETGSLDPKNIAEAKQRKEMWIEKDRLFNINDDDEWLPFNFKKKKQIQQITHSPEVVEEYFDYIKFYTFDKDVKEMIRNDMSHMPLNDLEFIKTNKVRILAVGKKRYYKRSKVGWNYIKLDKYDVTEGNFAHEFAHMVFDVNELYKDSDYSLVLNNVFNSIKKYKFKEFDGIEYVTVESDLFVRKYQGRTYVTKEDFLQRGCVLDAKELVEYISVGYETFTTNPELLYSKDRELYNYFSKIGMVKNYEKKVNF